MIPFKPQSIEPLAVSVEETARLTGLGRTFLFALLKDGRLRSLKVGRRRLVPIEAIQELMRKVG